MENIDVCCNDCENFESVGMGLGNCVAAQERLAGLGFSVQCKVEYAWNTISNCPEYKETDYARDRRLEAECYHVHG